jgi:PEP-CTERM motif
MRNALLFVTGGLSIFSNPLTLLPPGGDVHQDIGSLEIVDMGLGGPNGLYRAVDSGSLDLSSVTSSVPEPSTWAMMLLGFVGLGFAFRRARRKLSFA